MRTSEFDYYLPEELIAQHPTSKRDEARMMVLDKITGKRQDKYFYNIIDFLKPGDVLVLNDTRVIPARLLAIDLRKKRKLRCFY